MLLEQKRLIRRTIILSVILILIGSLMFSRALLLEKFKPSTMKNETSSPFLKCMADWKCNEWSSCSDGKQDRECRDASLCNGGIKWEGRECSLNQQLLAPIKELPATIYSPWALTMCAAIIIVLIVVLVILVIASDYQRRSLVNFRKMINEDAERAISSRNRKKAEAIYHRIKKYYEKLPYAKKRLYHKKILGIHRQIIRLKRN